MTTLTHALLADVLASLEHASGTQLGTAAHLRVQELVRQLPDDTKPEDLKTLLAPLLCKSSDEQEQFYEIFRRSWVRVQETGELEEAEMEEVEAAIKVEQMNNRWIAVLGAIVFLGCGFLAWYLMAWKNTPLQSSEYETLTITVGDGEKSRCFDGIRVDIFNKPNAITIQTSSWSRIKKFESIHFGKDNGHAGLRIDTTLHCVYYRGIREGDDSVRLRLRSEHEFFHEVTLIIKVIPKDSVNQVQLKDTTQRPDTALYLQRPIPHPRDLSQLEPPQPTATQQILMDYEWPLKALFILLSGILLWWLAHRIERKRRRLIAEHRPNVKPPYTWNIALGGEPEVTFGEDFYTLLLQLRRRESDELWRLDMPRTIRATVDRGGLPQFKYAQQTRPAEYLLLIDRQSGRDHQARLFDLLYRSFRGQEVLVERYWYDEGDPRRCYNEAHPNGLALRDLHYYHPQSRLLLLGNAYALLHPNTGQPMKWAVQTFSAWTDRAVLSPQPLSTFGRRERNLQDLFHVLPASLSGVRDVIELFDADESKTPDLNPRRFPDATQEPIVLVDNDLIKTLEGMLDQGQKTLDHEPFIVPSSSFLVWIAACAMYPELHWDLTLQLGHLLDGMPSTSVGVTSSHADTPHDQPSLLTHTSLQLLTRLPWFVEGEMPLEVRQTLLAWLEREHPDTHYRLREGLHRLLSQNPPPANSAAYDDYAMNLALNEWLYTRDRDRKKQLQRDIAARLAAGQPADFMVLRMLEPQRTLTPEQFVVPDDWKKHLREKGFAFLNPRRAWWWAVPVWLVLSGVGLWWAPERVECKGESVVYQGHEYCIETEVERQIFREMLMLEALELGEMGKADSIIEKSYGNLLELKRILNEIEGLKAQSKGIQSQNEKLKREIQSQNEELNRALKKRSNF